jgi:RimJ/RimL family protein N-acetyltransferase
MSFIDDQIYKTKTGQAFIVKTALPMDAEGTREFMYQALSTNKHFIQLPYEFTRSKSEEKKILKNRWNSKNEITLIAVSNSKIIGLLMVNTNSKTRTLHTGEFGIAILKEAQGLGIGNAMMEALLNWAKALTSLERIELRVHAENEAAIKLYKKFGFNVEGRRIRAIKYDDGIYMDELIMCYHLTNPSEFEA